MPPRAAHAKAAKKTPLLSEAEQAKQKLVGLLSSEKEADKKSVNELVYLQAWKTKKVDEHSTVKQLMGVGPAVKTTLNEAGSFEKTDTWKKVSDPIRSYLEDAGIIGQKAAYKAGDVEYMFFAPGKIDTLLPDQQFSKKTKGNYYKVSAKAIDGIKKGDLATHGVDWFDSLLHAFMFAVQVKDMENSSQVSENNNI